MDRTTFPGAAAGEGSSSVATEEGVVETGALGPEVAAGVGFEPNPVVNSRVER
jgi:hypothetical protein